MATKTQIQNSERFSFNFNVDPNLVSALIGYNGTGVRRIRERVRNGCYIRIEKDGKAKIEAYTQAAVKEAAKLIFNDYKALQNPEAHRSKPTGEIQCDPTCVPHMVGKQGVGIKSIMGRFPGSFIVYDDGRFKITANTMDDVQRIISILKDQNRDCLKWQDEQRRKREQKTTPETSDVSNFGDNPYAALAPETSPREETKPLPVKKRYGRGQKTDLTLRSNSKIDSLKSEYSTGQKTRALLAELRGCPVEEIPWKDVQTEIERMKMPPPSTYTHPPPTEYISSSDFPKTSSQNVELVVSEKPKWGSKPGALERVRSGSGTYSVAPSLPKIYTPKSPELPPNSHLVHHAPRPTVTELDLDLEF